MDSTRFRIPLDLISWIFKQMPIDVLVELDFDLNLISMDSNYGLSTF